MSSCRLRILIYASLFFPQCVASPKAFGHSAHLFDLWVDDPLVYYDAPHMHYDMSTVESYFDLTSSAMAVEGTTFDGILNRYLFELDVAAHVATNANAFEGPTSLLPKSHQGAKNNEELSELEQDMPNDSLALSSELDANATEAEYDTSVSYLRTNDVSLGTTERLEQDDKATIGKEGQLNIDETESSERVHDMEVTRRNTSFATVLEGTGASDDIEEQAYMKRAKGEQSMAAAANFRALDHDSTFKNEIGEELGVHDLANSPEALREDGERDATAGAQAASTQKEAWLSEEDTQMDGQFGVDARIFEINSQATNDFHGDSGLDVLDEAQEDIKFEVVDQLDTSASMLEDEEAERASESELEVDEMDARNIQSINLYERVENGAGNAMPVGGGGDVEEALGANQRDYIDDAEASEAFTDELHEKPKSSLGVIGDETTRSPKVDFEGGFDGSSQLQGIEAPLVDDESPEATEIELHGRADGELGQSHEGASMELGRSEVAVASELEVVQLAESGESGGVSTGLDDREAAEMLEGGQDDKVDEEERQFDNATVAFEEVYDLEEVKGELDDNASPLEEFTRPPGNIEDIQETDRNEFAGVVLEGDEASVNSKGGTCEEYDESDSNDSTAVLDGAKEAPESESITLPHDENACTVETSDEESIETSDEIELSGDTAGSLEDNGGQDLPERDLSEECGGFDQERCAEELLEGDTTKMAVEGEVGDGSDIWDQIDDDAACESEEAKFVNEEEYQSLTFVEGSDATGACEEELDDEGDEREVYVDAVVANVLCEDDQTDSYEDIRLGEVSEQGVHDDEVEADLESSEDAQLSCDVEYADTSDDSVQDDDCDGVDLEGSEVGDKDTSEVPKTLSSDALNAPEEDVGETINDISALSEVSQFAEELASSTSAVPEMVASVDRESSQKEESVDQGKNSEELEEEGHNNEDSISQEDQECAASWPASLASGESLDQRSFLEVCQLLQGVCECAHAAVERNDASEKSTGEATQLLPLARFVVYTGKAPFSRSEDPAAVDLSALAMRPLVWSSSKGLATGPESGDAESGSDASAVQEKEHVSLVLHADGNLLLSRQFPRLKRREVIWETASGGEFSKYLLELLIDLEGPYFQVSDIAENPEEKPRIIYTSRLGDVSLRRIDKESDLQDATTRPGLRWQEKWKSIKDNTKEELDNLRDATQGVRQGLGHLWNRFKKPESNGQRGHD